MTASKILREFWASEGSRIGPKFTWVAIAIFAGGAEVVAGYFLYVT